MPILLKYYVYVRMRFVNRELLAVKSNFVVRVVTTLG